MLALRAIGGEIAHISGTRFLSYGITTQAMKTGDKRRVKRQKRAFETFKAGLGTNEEVLSFDIRAFRNHISSKVSDNGSQGPEEQEDRSVDPLPERFSEIEVNISSISSTGDGLGICKDSDQVYVVPFTAPGDVVKAKVIRHVEDLAYTLTDFLRVIQPGPRRDDSLIRCPYFASCAGCQLQMLPYEDQLKHKKTIVENAYLNFSSLAPEAMPAVLETTGSPMQYGYRTKLTPHFDAPPRSDVKEAQRNGESIFKSVPPIGFMVKGTRRTLDIEDCPIGTDAVRRGITIERERVAKEISKYKRGATLLLRESTTRKGTAGKPFQSREAPKSDDVSGPGTKFSEVKTCITDSNATATEYIDKFVFYNTAGAFFQNNNSILPVFTAYIRSCIKHHNPSSQPIDYLIDAYCGSGLFTVALSALFKASLGIDISEPSVAAAERNAKANNVKNARFITADAARLFESVEFDADSTAVVIDPPRKGCDEQFLSQLLAFAPKRVVYVSCNVHTQARDVGVLVQGREGVRYEIESLRGFDFFPQTGHVEGVAVLSRVEGDVTASAGQ